MGASDRTGAGWVLMALAVGAGWWYWQLLPGERRKVLSGAGIGAGGASGGGGATGLYDPAANPPPAGTGPPTDDQLKRQGQERSDARVPFDAGVRLIGVGWN